MQKDYRFQLKPTKSDELKLVCSRIFVFICLSCCVLMLYFNLAYSIAPVSGQSMSPTLNYGESYISGELQDKVVLNYIKSYHKGDIIVAKKIYNDDSENFIYVIKRLIAVGGDSVEIKSNGDVYVNDEKLEESYVKSTKKASTYEYFVRLKASKPELFEEDKLIVPDGEVFYLGDNRGASFDCSYYGPVKSNLVIAKVDFIIKANENVFLSICKQIFNIK